MSWESDPEGESIKVWCQATVLWAPRGKGRDPGGLGRAPGRRSSQGLWFESGVLPGVHRRKVDRALGQTVDEPLSPSAWALLVQDCAPSGEGWGPQGWRRLGKAGREHSQLGASGLRDV